MRSPLPDLAHDGDVPVLVWHRAFDATLDELWAALTQSDRLERWIGTWTGDPASGSVEFTLTDAEVPLVVAIEVCETPHRLVVDIDHWQLDLELDSHEDGSTLRLAVPLRWREPLDHAVGVWAPYLDGLGAVVDDEPVPPREADPFLATTRFAAALLDVGRWQEGVALLEDELAAREHLLGAEHHLTLAAVNELGLAYTYVGREPEAIPLHERKLTVNRHLHGADDRDTFISSVNLAAAYRRVGRVEEAIALLEEAVETSRRMVGEENQDTIGALDGLGAALMDAERYGEALVVRRQAMAAAERALGGGHSMVETLDHNLGYALVRLGQYDEAIERYERVLRSRREAADDRPEALLTATNLAVAYEESGRLAEAIALASESSETQRRVLGDEHPDTLMGRSNLARMLAATGRREEAIAILREAVAVATSAHGADHPRTVKLRSNLAAHT